MSGLFGAPTISVPATPPVAPAVRQPTPDDAYSQAASNRAQQQLFNLQGVESTDLSGPGSKRGSAPYSGTVLGK
jgi:hypothetical protein